MATTTKVWSGARLKQLRLRKGWSQEEFARAADTSVTNISRYERDRVKPGANMVARLAHALGTEEGELYEDAASDDDEEAASMGSHLFDRAIAAAVQRALKAAGK